MPRGKVIGGLSSINGLIFSRGQKMDFDVWAQKGSRAGPTMMCFLIFVVTGRMKIVKTTI